MLPFPERVWLVQREYERSGGIETVESIITHPDMLPMCRDLGYTIKEFVSADTHRALAKHAADLLGAAGASGAAAMFDPDYVLPADDLDAPPAQG